VSAIKKISLDFFLVASFVVLVGCECDLYNGNLVLVIFLSVSAMHQLD
jgi:hypothetical protein